MTTPVSHQAAVKTNGRAIPWTVRVLQGLAYLAPGFVEDQALKLWGTPMRTRREPESAGLTGHKFRVEGKSGRLWVWDFGIGPTVMLVHGWSGSASQMSHFIGPLVRAGFNAVAVDLPAHGQSGGKQTTVLEMAQAIAEVADKVKPVEAIIAHSLGATAAALAHGGGLKVKKMTLIAPPSNVPYYVHGFAKRIGLSHDRGDGMLEKLQRRFGDLEQFNVLRVAPKFTAQGLVMHAVGDREVPFEQGEAIAHAWPGAKLEVLTRGTPSHGTNHHWPLKDERVVQQVVSWLRDEQAGVRAA